MREKEEQEQENRRSELHVFWNIYRGIFICHFAGKVISKEHAKPGQEHEQGHFIDTKSADMDKQGIDIA